MERVRLTFICSSVGSRLGIVGVALNGHVQAQSVLVPWTRVTEWIKTQLPQRFMPRLTFSFNLIRDLLFLAVVWERQSEQIKAVTSLWTNHADLVQWKKTLFGFA